MRHLSCLRLRVLLADAAAHRAYVIAMNASDDRTAAVWFHAVDVRARVAANLERRA